MRGTPPLHDSNRFSCLDIEEYSSNFIDEPPLDVPKPTEAMRKEEETPKWEKKLPKRFTLASTPDAKSLRIPIELRETERPEVRRTNALIDCGASDLFLDVNYVSRERLTTKKLSKPIPVHNVDGTPNEAGPIAEIAELDLSYKGHTERAIFAITALGDQDVILGLPWLREHNPEVDWATGEVKMSRCPRQCHTCRAEDREERRVWKIGV
jgi:hypothetical protein